MPPLDPDTLHPIDGQPSMAFLKPLIAGHPKIEAGDYTYVHSFGDVLRFEDQVLYAFDFIEDRLVIGKYGSIAHGARFILNGGNHFADRLSTYPFSIVPGFGAPDPGPWPNKGSITIGHDVWIGHEAVILPGVTVGDGAIIAAQAVVASDVAPYAVVGGNPAKPIKSRLPDEQIERMLALAWWDWPPEQVARAAGALMRSDVAALEALAPAN